ncbi:MAG TPA: hypothetical protein VFI95_13415 [Terriglobales bacterium]|nr:hypothetical protein [Terriglobales bacterium]
MHIERPSRTEVKVDCYSGYKGEERPLRFRLNGRDYQVSRILEQWYEPGHALFKIQADDGDVYILDRDLSRRNDEWSLNPFRSAVLPSRLT